VWFLREQKHTRDGLWPKKPPRPQPFRLQSFSPTAILPTRHFAFSLIAGLWNYSNLQINSVTARRVYSKPIFLHPAWTHAWRNTVISHRCNHGYGVHSSYCMQQFGISMAGHIVSSKIVVAGDCISSKIAMRFLWSLPLQTDCSFPLAVWDLLTTWRFPVGEYWCEFLGEILLYALSRLWCVVPTRGGKCVTCCGVIF
jgi:hypothetical protein